MHARKESFAEELTGRSLAVLGLRGREVVSQPVQDDDGNVLLWNGEVFGGIEVRSGEAAR